MAPQDSPHSWTVIAPLVAMGCWPLLATQLWLTMAVTALNRRGAETDRGDIEGQLPVPDAIQESMDSEIFA